MDDDSHKLFVVPLLAHDPSQITMLNEKLDEFCPQKIEGRLKLKTNISSQSTLQPLIYYLSGCADGPVRVHPRVCGWLESGWHTDC